MTTPVVALETGQVSGKIDDGVNGQKFFSFQGIPYAKPPLGDLRFKAPEPPEPWNGVKSCTEPGEDCYSKHPVMRDTMIGGEDCLYLNVYTPNLPRDGANLKSVMVWIHGGGFTSGSGSSLVYGPEFLMTQDVVLVTINYRTGVLGFLSLEDPNLDVPGNAGLKDQVMALKWVKKNIKNFGGDPNNVTIFGESAGAASVHYLILSPTAKGLFHKAILQSGCALNLWARGKRCANQLVKNLNRSARSEKEILNILQQVSLHELYNAALRVPDHFIIDTKRPFGPVIEKPSKTAFLTKEPLEIIKSGNYTKCPIIIGYTTREGMLSEVMQRPAKVKPHTDFRRTVPYPLCKEIKNDRQKLDMVAKKIKQFYYGAEEPTTENLDKFFTMESDNFFVREIFQAINLHLDTSPYPIYVYRMSVETNLNLMKKMFEIKGPGVCHADDLGYLFMNAMTPEVEEGSDEHVALERFLKFWTNFAKYGDPNPKEQDAHIDVEWPVTTKKALDFIDIGNKLSVGTNPEARRLQFWHDIFQIHPKHKL